MIVSMFLISLYFDPPGTPSDHASSLAQLSILLTGSWTSQDGTVEEHWTTARGGLMLGMNRDASKQGKAFFEYIRIEIREDGVFYVAHPNGRDGTSFQLSRLEGKKAVFENAGHDFPQVITYIRRDADHLCAAIGTKEKWDRITWCWQSSSLVQEPASK